VGPGRPALEPGIAGAQARKLVAELSDGLAQRRDVTALVVKDLAELYVLRFEASDQIDIID
jgi:hypothetical protein